MQLSGADLKKEDVLWVRFDKEIEEFDYESLSSYTYHSLYGQDSTDVIDKYIKGQEFSIVVIEGLPECLNNESDDPEEKKKMWLARRQIYLVASRSTSFLFFAKSGRENPEDLTEILQICEQTSQPDFTSDKISPSGNEWKLSSPRGDQCISMRAYLDKLDAAVESIRPTESHSSTVEVEETEQQQNSLQAEPLPRCILQKPITPQSIELAINKPRSFVAHAIRKTRKSVSRQSEIGEEDAKEILRELEQLTREIEDNPTKFHKIDGSYQLRRVSSFDASQNKLCRRAQR